MHVSIQNSAHTQHSNFHLSPSSSIPINHLLPYPPPPLCLTQSHIQPPINDQEAHDEFQRQLNEFFHQSRIVHEEWLNQRSHRMTPLTNISLAPTLATHLIINPESSTHVNIPTTTHEPLIPDSPPSPSHSSHLPTPSTTPRSHTRSTSTTSSNSSTVSSHPSTPVIQSKYRIPFTVRPLTPITPIRPFSLTGSHSSSHPSTPLNKSQKSLSAYPSTSSTPYYTIRLIHTTPQRIFTPVPLKERKIEPLRTSPSIHSIATLLSSPLAIESLTTKFSSTPHLSHILSALGQLFTTLSTSIAG
jgi:hypothetical protein